jgi:putative hydrolase of the HAD superfamily
MTKAILFDADGVVLKKQKEYFSVRFAREYGAPLDEVTAFFKNEFRLCQESKLDLKEELAKRLPAWGWNKSVDEYLEYWFTSDVDVDADVMQVVAECRSKGIKCYLATDQEKYRTAYLRKKVGLAEKFDDLLVSCEVGFTKSQVEYFTKAISRLGLLPEEIAYWDDDQKNVDIALSVGIDAHFYTTLVNLTNKLA